MAVHDADSKRAYRIFYDPSIPWDEKRQLLTDLLPNPSAQWYLNSMGKVELFGGSPEPGSAEAIRGLISSLGLDPPDQDPVVNEPDEPAEGDADSRHA